MNWAFHRAAAAGLTALVLGVAGCSDDKPVAAPQDKAEALKREAEQQRQMHEREVHNK
jgi:hypothetical protein